MKNGGGFVKLYRHLLYEPPFNGNEEFFGFYACLLARAEYPTFKVSFKREEEAAKRGKSKATIDRWIHDMAVRHLLRLEQGTCKTVITMIEPEFEGDEKLGNEAPVRQAQGSYEAPTPLEPAPILSSEPLKNKEYNNKELVNSIIHLEKDPEDDNEPFLEEKIRPTALPPVKPSTSKGNRIKGTMPPSPAAAVIEDYNRVFGTKKTLPPYAKIINRLFNNGHTLEQFQIVHAYKFKNRKPSDKPEWYTPTSIYRPENFVRVLDWAESEKPNPKNYEVPEGAEFEKPEAWF